MTIRDEIRAALARGWPMGIDAIFYSCPSKGQNFEIGVEAMTMLEKEGKIKRGGRGPHSDDVLYQIAHWPVDANKVDAPAERAPAVIVTDGCVVVRLADGGIVLAQRKVKFSESTEIAPAIVRAIVELAKAAP